MNINQNPNLHYPQDVTRNNLRGIKHQEADALDLRFPKGWTIGPMGGAWFAWDHLGNGVGFGNSRKECITATLKNNKSVWCK